MHLGKYNNSPSRKFFWIFVVFVALGALVVINFILSSATIILRPKIEQKNSTISLTIDTKALKPDLANNILTGKIVESQGEVTKNITDVSTRKVEDFAKGSVKIKNIWKKDFFLQKGAQLVQGESPESVGSGPKNIFILDNDTIAVAEGEVQATATAKNKGLAGDIPPGKFYFLRMSKWNRERIWAENAENFTGGEIETKVVDQYDINKAIHTVAEEDLGKREMEKFKSQLSGDTKVSPALTRVELLESRASILPEAPSDNFDLYIKGRVSSIVYNEKDLKDAAVEKFKEQVGANQEIASIDENNIKYQLMSNDSSLVADGRAEVKVSIPAVLAPKLPSKILDKKSIIGYNAAALRERYAKFPEIESIDVKFFPFWVKSVPSLEGRVSFDIRTD